MEKQIGYKRKIKKVTSEAIDGYSIALKTVNVTQNKARDNR